jgi:hypothetical protein
MQRHLWVVEGWNSYSLIQRQLFSGEFTILTRNALHSCTGVFRMSAYVPISAYTQKRLYPKAPIPKSAYTQKRLYRKAHIPKSAYTQKHYIKQVFG